MDDVLLDQFCFLDSGPNLPRLHPPKHAFVELQERLDCHVLAVNCALSQTGVGTIQPHEAAGTGFLFCAPSMRRER